MIIVYLFYYYIEVVFLDFNCIFMMFLSQFFYKFSELEFLYLRIKCYQDARHLDSSCDLYVVINLIFYSHWTIVEFYYCLGFEQPELYTSKLFLHVFYFLSSLWLLIILPFMLHLVSVFIVSLHILHIVVCSLAATFCSYLLYPLVFVVIFVLSYMHIRQPVSCLILQTFI